ncbi:uncharacterized protein LOC124810273 [Hydra vulgaris]|uniref:uncharacterized protein LOC124810273 n=1 Tax=Hydra vulgaris TaxID=6087 RepID=UPI001F5E7566|nr:uncharacterized protein LOC124810273 [Hydra vulgaris]
MQCLKASCDCDEYTKKKDFNLCAYCDHAPVLHKLEDSFNLIEDVQSVDFTKSNPMQNTLSTSPSMSSMFFEPQNDAKENEDATLEPAFLNESEKGFNVCSNDFMSPLKKHCMFPDTVLTNKVISTSKTIVHNKSCALFESVEDAEHSIENIRILYNYNNHTSTFCLCCTTKHCCCCVQQP